MSDDIRRTTLGGAAQLRRHYEALKVPFISAQRARRDVLRLLEERKVLQRAGEALMTASLPFSGDPVVKTAIDEFRAVLEG